MYSLPPWVAWKLSPSLPLCGRKRHPSRRSHSLELARFGGCFGQRSSRSAPPRYQAAPSVMRVTSSARKDLRPGRRAILRASLEAVLAVGAHLGSLGIHFRPEIAQHHERLGGAQVLEGDARLSAGLGAEVLVLRELVEADHL